MAIKPTLRCHCSGNCREPAFSYTAPPEGETPFDLKGQPYRRAFERCRICGHWFGRHDLDLSDLYTGHYVDRLYGGNDGLRQKFETIMALPPEKSDNRGRVARVCALAARFGLPPAPGLRLLDVGAGLGVFPAAMKAAGWMVTALETDPRTVEHLRQVAGVAAVAGDLREWQSNTSERFHLITFNKVLEHIEDPVEMLMAAKALLLQNGFIYVELPDADAAAWGPGREEFFIEHHHVFSPASLALMASNAGCRLLNLSRIVEPSHKHTLCGMLGGS